MIQQILRTNTLIDSLFIELSNNKNIKVISKKIEMQKQTMFQSFLKKKQLIAQMITETKSMTSKDKSMTDKDKFSHFEAVSEPVYIKAESNAIYLTHLNNEFKDHLREFVHEQEGFSQTMFQLAKITQVLETDRNQYQNQYRCIRNALNQTQLEKAILTDKNNFHLDNILSLQEQAKTQQLIGEQHEKTATQLQQQIQYQHCMLHQIKQRNNQIISNLQVKTVQIQQSTTKMQNTEKSIRHKQSSIKKINQTINHIYYTLEAQDDSLNDMCTAIEQGLNAQNDRINDIEFGKNRLGNLVGETRLRKEELAKAQQTEMRLLDYHDDLGFQLRRVAKELQIQHKAIDQEHWRIEQQRLRLEENHIMLRDLQKYLQNLIHKNDLLQQSLEQQIIQDHTIKKIVDSKTHQPVGKKTKLFLEQYQESSNSYNKELADTSSSWKENHHTDTSPAWKQNNHKGTSPAWKQSQNNKSQHNLLPLRNTGVAMTPKQRRQLVERQVNKLARKGPRQIEFMFEKKMYSQQPQQQLYGDGNEMYEREEYEQGEDCMVSNKWQTNPYMYNTGFSYIDKLAKFDNQP